MAYSGGAFYKILLHLTVLFQCIWWGEVSLSFSHSLSCSPCYFFPFKTSDIVRVHNSKQSWLECHQLSLGPRYCGGAREILQFQMALGHPSEVLLHNHHKHEGVILPRDIRIGPNASDFSLLQSSQQHRGPEPKLGKLACPHHPIIS